MNPFKGSDEGRGEYISTQTSPIFEMVLQPIQAWLTRNCDNFPKQVWLNKGSVIASKYSPLPGIFEPVRETWKNQLGLHNNMNYSPLARGRKTMIGKFEKKEMPIRFLSIIPQHLSGSLYLLDKNVTVYTDPIYILWFFGFFSNLHFFVKV
jgi:hypothetical protein